MQQSTRSGQSQPMPMKTPIDLFVHELSDIQSAEQIIAQMLGTAAQAASNSQLKQGLQQHQQQSQQQAQNIQQVFQMIGQQPHQVRCYAAEGLMQSLQDGLSQAQSPEVKDGLIVAGALKTENLEIASYTGLIEKAQLIGQRDIARLLQQNLDQEQQMLRKVHDVGQQLDQQAAQMMSGLSQQQSQMGTSAQG